MLLYFYFWCLFGFFWIQNFRLGIIGNAIIGLFLLAGLAGYNAMSCQDILQNEKFQEAFPDYTLDDCKLVKTSKIFLSFNLIEFDLILVFFSVILIGILVGLVVCLIGFTIDLLLIRGVKTVSFKVLWIK